MIPIKDSKLLGRLMATKVMRSLGIRKKLAFILRLRAAGGIAAMDKGDRELVSNAQEEYEKKRGRISWY